MFEHLGTTAVKTPSTFLLAVTAALLGGAMPVVVKLGVTELPPGLFTCLRFCIAALVILPFVNLQSFRQSKFRSLPNLVLVVLGNAANVILFAFAIPYVSPTLSQLLYFLGPLIVCLGSALFLKEPPSLRNLGGVALGFMGAGIAISEGIRFGSSKGGILLVLVAVISHASFVLFSRSLRAVYSPSEQTVVMAIVCAVASGGLSFGFEAPLKAHISATSLLTLLYVGIIGGAAYYFIQQRIITQTSALAAASIIYVQPIATYGWSFLVFRENLSFLTVLGGVVAVFGAYLASQRAVKPPAVLY